jgi:hypothetical protein
MFSPVSKFTDKKRESCGSSLSTNASEIPSLNTHRVLLYKD